MAKPMSEMSVEELTKCRDKFLFCVTDRESKFHMTQPDREFLILANQYDAELTRRATAAMGEET